MRTHMRDKKNQPESAAPEQPEPATPPSPEPSTSSFDPEPEESSPSLPIKQQSRAIQARWAGEAASKEDLEHHFRTLPIDKAMALLARMRENNTLAGTIMNERINEQNQQRCKTCGKSADELAKRPGGFRGWRMDRPYYHPEDRNIRLVDHFCSDVCIARENQKKDGVKGIPDRGMLASDNPQNRPGGKSIKDLHAEAI